MFRLNLKPSSVIRGIDVSSTYDLRNGPDKNESNNGNEHVGIQLVCKKVITFLLSVLTFD